MVIKISGALLNHSEFDKTVSYIKKLHEKGVKIIVVYGGGQQITEQCAKEDISREKGKDGFNATTKIAINKAVLPVYNAKQQKLEELFGKENTNIFSKEDIVGERIEGLGEVGKVKEFKKEFSEDKINIIPFVGEYKGEVLNINADDVVYKVVEDISSKISNILFLTSIGGLEKKDKQICEFITTEQLDCVSKGTHDKIECIGGMQKKIETIQALFKLGISKVTMTNLEGLKEEIEGFGSGTMVVDIKKAKFKDIFSKELFDKIYDNNPNWKDRTDEEKTEIFSSYTVLDLEGTVLGGYALNDHEIDGEKGKLLECIFTPKEGSGIGYVLGKEIKKHDKVFAYSKHDKFFKNLGFKKDKSKKSESGASLFVYDTI